LSSDDTLDYPYAAFGGVLNLCAFYRNQFDL
jgi:hypothetical protein